MFKNLIFLQKYFISQLTIINIFSSYLIHISLSQYIKMRTNKKLPMLKLFLYPVLAGIGYGAYCYYSQQYQYHKNKQHSHLKYMHELLNLLEQSYSLHDLKRIYGLMAKHIDTYIIDPSRKDTKVLDHRVSREYESKISVTGNYKIDTQYQINLFNNKQEKLNGDCTLGVWSNTNKTIINQMEPKSSQSIINIAQKSIKLRQSKCKNIANMVSNDLEKGYLQQYIQCMGVTNKSVAQLQRQIDLTRKVIKHQLIR